MFDRTGDFFQMYSNLIYEYDLWTQTAFTITLQALIPIVTFLLTFLLSALPSAKVKWLASFNRPLAWVLLNFIIFTALMASSNYLANPVLKTVTGYLVILGVLSSAFLLVSLNNLLNKMGTDFSPALRKYPTVFSLIIGNRIKYLVLPLFRKVSALTFLYAVLFEYLVDTGYGIGSLIRAVSGYWNYELLFIVLLHTIIIWAIIHSVICFLLSFIFNEEDE